MKAILSALFASAKNLLFLGVALALVAGGVAYWRYVEREKTYLAVIHRLSAESRRAEILVTQSSYDENSKKIETTIKFLEYDASQNPLPAKYFTFQGNLLQFQTLVVRFDDDLVKKGDPLKGKSLILFLKVFSLDGKNTEEFEITPTGPIPLGYKLPDTHQEYEKDLWGKFWSYALDPEMRKGSGIKNAQIEAPGSMFLPGMIYRLVVEHDGGMRIDAEPLPTILRGELLERKASAGR